MEELRNGGGVKNHWRELQLSLKCLCFIVGFVVQLVGVFMLFLHGCLSDVGEYIIQLQNIASLNFLSEKMCLFELVTSHTRWL